MNTEGDHELCERCGEAVREPQIVWLKNNPRTGLWYDPAVKQVAGDQDAMAFPFSRGCANKQLGGGAEAD